MGADQLLSEINSSVSVIIKLDELVLLCSVAIQSAVRSVFDIFTSSMVPLKSTSNPSRIPMKWSFVVETMVPAGAPQPYCG